MHGECNISIVTRWYGLMSINKNSIRKAVALLKWLTAILIAKVTYQIISNYPDYFPPNFDSAFLLGREGHFQGFYRLAFYAHILASPFSLLGGLFLINEGFRRRFPYMHRTIGKFQIGLVIFLVVPSGLWMSQYALTGLVAGLGFASLAIATGVCTVWGWRLAVHKRFELHRRWMIRSFILLCSAVFLRLVAGAVTIGNLDVPWLYPFSAWMTWVVPLVVFEAWNRCRD